ncbi:MAG: nickel pincer cofactor biosynthesis protein LarC [Smithellaceae bacterium]|nr:nickel pincer cofactor biosynthesis protein LarC [Smithellaceae bacterium]
MKILVFDPVGGASGDMILGSLVHLGCPLDYLKTIYDTLGLGGFRIKTSLEKVSGIESLDLSFAIAPEKKNRNHADIVRLISRAKLPTEVRKRSLAAFAALAEAEAKVHGEKPAQVHFHELGALDSILDIVGISAAIAWFGVEKIYSLPLPMGSGTVKCRHGILPVPAPATTILLEGMKVRWPDVEGELTTPTAAAIFKTMTIPGEPPEVTIFGSGYGRGDKRYGDWPNLFRAILCETPDEKRERVYVIEGDVDDMIPEDWEVVQQRLFDLGVLDVVLTPQIMKRGRPGVNLRVLVRDDLLPAASETILNETTTIGIRCYPVERIVLPRSVFSLTTPYGKIAVKEVITPAGERRYKPEFKDLQRIADTKGLPLSRLRKDIEMLIVENSKKEKKKKS